MTQAELDELRARLRGAGVPEEHLPQHCQVAELLAQLAAGAPLSRALVEELVGQQQAAGASPQTLDHLRTIGARLVELRRPDPPRGPSVAPPRPPSAGPPPPRARPQGGSARKTTPPPAVSVAGAAQRSIRALSEQSVFGYVGLAVVLVGAYFLGVAGRGGYASRPPRPGLDEPAGHEEEPYDETAHANARCAKVKAAGREATAWLSASSRHMILKWENDVALSFVRRLREHGARAVYIAETIRVSMVDVARELMIELPEDPELRRSFRDWFSTQRSAEHQTMEGERCLFVVMED